MPPKADPRIDAYIAKAAPFARPILTRLRQLVHAACPEVEETIKWGHPSFIYRGKILCGMAAFKAHLGFGFWHQGMEELLEKQFGHTLDAMGLLGRIAAPADLPSNKTLLRLIKTAVKLHDSGTPTRAKPKPKPALPVPADLAAALKRSKRAAAAWTDFSPSARREYTEWIPEAKRPETRQKRLLTAVEWISDGKKRNWQYENC